MPFAALAAERVDGPVASYLAAWPGGAGRRMLALRARWPATFADGAYVPLRAALGRHAVAFARCSARATVVVVATRLAGRLLGEAPELPRVGAQWGDTAVVLPRDIDGPWMDGLEARDAVDVAGRILPLDRCLASLPVAVLVAAHPPSRVGDVGSRASLRCTLHDRQPVGRQRGPALARRVVVLHHDQVLFDQREDILAVDLELLRCAMREQRGSCAVSMLVPRWRLREMRAGEQHACRDHAGLRGAVVIGPPARGAMWHHTAARARCKVFNGV